MFRYGRLFRASRRWQAVQSPVHYDMCVIGGGPAGVAAAMRAVSYNKKVCLVERARVGGTDLWNGAVQSKTMWEFSSLYSRFGGEAAVRAYGSSMQPYVQIDEEQMRETLNTVSATRESQLLASLKASNVTVVRGQATFLNDKEVVLHDNEAKQYQRVSADYYIIATGSKPREHSFVNVDGSLVVTSDQIMQQPLPKSLVVIGAGVIGCEFASIYGGLGQTKVYLIDKAPRILPGEDDDVVSVVEGLMTESNVTIHRGSTLYDLQAWEETPEEAAQLHPSDPTPRRGVQYTIMNRKTKALETYHVDRALLAIGRVPNYDDLSLENTSVRVVDGMLVVDQFGRCTDTVYAVGDASPGMHLVSMAQAKAEVAVDSIYGQRKSDMNGTRCLHESMSSVAFLTKTVASVGLNEHECRQRNIGYIACNYGFDLVSRTVAAANTDGFIKIIVSNDDQLRILGVRALGMNASTLVDLGALAIQRNQTVYDISERLTAYPAVSQGFQECLRAILGNSTLKPNSVFPSLKVTRWEPENFERGAVYQAQEKAKHAAVDNKTKQC